MRTFLCLITVFFSVSGCDVSLERKSSDSRLINIDVSISCLVTLLGNLDEGEGLIQEKGEISLEYRNEHVDVRYSPENKIANSITVYIESDSFMSGDFSAISKALTDKIIRECSA